MNEVRQQPEVSATPEEHYGAGRQIVIVLLAAAGGFLGILGSFVAEVQRGETFILLPVVIAAPVIEEALKPAGVYISLLKWPRALRSQLQIALLCALGGFVFGMVESWIYVNVYYPDASEALVRWRYTVAVGLHTVCSFIYGWGVNRGIIDWAAGRGRIGSSTRRAYITAVALHGAYNLAVIVLAVAGVLSFDD